MKVDFSNNKILKEELEKGNHQVMVFLMNKYHHSLCLYVYSLTNNHEDSKDIVQNVFIKLWERRLKVQSIKSMKSFLYTSVYNGFIDHWRKDKKMFVIEEKHFEALNQIVENENEDSFKRQIEFVKLEIQKLPPRCKETFILSKQDGLTNDEIAAFMNVSTRTVETQMNKAYRILREKLKEKVKPILFLLLRIDFNKKILNLTY